MLFAGFHRPFLFPDQNLYVIRWNQEGLKLAVVLITFSLGMKMIRIGVSIGIELICHNYFTSIFLIIFFMPVFRILFVSV